MSLNRREFMSRSLVGAALVSGGLAELLRAKGIRMKVGVTDWNLRQTAKIEAVALAKKIGFDGVEISLGRGNDNLPVANPDVQRQYLEESKRHKLPIASTCLDILHRNYLKNDPLGQRWVADSISITKNLGARVILLPFFGNGALRTRAEMAYVADFLREIAPAAEKAGVILGLENTNAAEDNTWMVERARSKAVLVYYDVGNSTRNGYDVVREIRWLGKDRICEFHLKDNPHYLGEGSIDFPAVVRAIADIEFQGWAHLETDSPSRVIEADLGRNLKFIRDLMQKQT